MMSLAISQLQILKEINQMLVIIKKSLKHLRTRTSRIRKLTRVSLVIRKRWYTLSINSMVMLKKRKEPKITRDTFESDEAYADWKLEQKAQELFEQQQNKLKEESNAIQMIERQKGEVVNKVKSLFETPDELKLYNDMVKFAMDNGFEDALKHDNGKDIKKFIDNSPIGPRVLQHLIGFPDKFNEIFNMDDSIDKKVELKLLEKELLHDIQMKKSKKPSNIDNKEMTNKEPVKPIGKLGVHGLGNGKQGDFSLDKIREIVKKHGR